MGTFDGLTTGLSALYAQRRAVEVTGQNIANVNTEGYSRQRVGMVADSGPVTPGLFSRYEGPGNGVRTVDVIRIRDTAGQEHDQRQTNGQFSGRCRAPCLAMP